MMGSDNNNPNTDSNGAGSQGPVGQGEYVVEQGDCISSIAFEHGFFWKTLWGDPSNSELKRERKNPFVLREGDLLTIPEKRLKEEACATDSRHRFRRKGVPEVLSLVLLDKKGKPRAGICYKLNIDGDARQGKTDSEGRIREFIPPDAQQGRLVLGEGLSQETVEMHLGHLDPTGDLSGGQMRLQNLGYDCGRMDGEETPEFVEAVEQFQGDYKLQLTGELDDATRKKLEELHGC